MSAQYLIRLDDACPTMCHERWAKIEQMLDEYGIKPIVGVIPNNKDPKMICGEYDNLFWNRVRDWQNKGWEISLHGYTHLMRPTNASQLLPYYSRSEFSGLSYYQQKKMILAGLEIFENNGVSTRVFIAPAHCFDEVTVRVLSYETEIDIISDGIAFKEFNKYGMIWIPQQLWDYKKKYFGLWTICIHPNTCSESRLIDVELFLRYRRNSIKALSDINLNCNRRKNVFENMYEQYFWRNWRSHHNNT